MREIWKPIEEMAFFIFENSPLTNLSSEDLAKDLYNAGYRKQSEVAREIFELVECAFSPALVYEGHTVKAYIAELKKKYTESERNNGKV